VSVPLQPELMDNHKVRSVSRLEVVETGRRRRWSEEDKLRIVAESYAGPRRVASTARRHGISRSLLTTWRRAWRAGMLGAHEVPGFSPVVVSPDPVPLTTPGHEVRSLTAAGRMEIEFGNGRRIVVAADVDGAALARVLAALEGR
jgi:transposase